jgi:hypothetical protein
VGEFACYQGFRDNPDDLPTARQHRIGNDAHESDMSAAVHQAIAVADEKLTQVCGCLSVEAIDTHL